MYVRFVELPVVDQDRAVAFYTQKLGLRVAQNEPYEEGWRWITLELPGARTKILLARKNPESVRTDVPSLVLTVDDVYRRYRELREKGVVFTTEPATAPWNDRETYAVFQDSEGNLVVLGSGGE